MQEAIPFTLSSALINYQRGSSHPNVVFRLCSVLSLHLVCRRVSFQGTTFLKLSPFQICMDANVTGIKLLPVSRDALTLLTKVAPIISKVLHSCLRKIPGGKPAGILEDLCAVAVGEVASA